MFNTPQTIVVRYAERRHFFYVYRYTTDQELIDALHKDKVEDSAAYVKGVSAYTDYYPKGDECGRMYLLDKSIETYTQMATRMAFGILQRTGLTIENQTFVGKADRAVGDLAALIGSITSALYSHSKQF